MPEVGRRPTELLLNPEKPGWIYEITQGRNYSLGDLGGAMWARATQKSLITACTERKVTSRWEKNEEGLKYTITIPASCTAEFIFPDGRQETVGAVLPGIIEQSCAGQPPIRVPSVASGRFRRRNTAAEEQAPAGLVYGIFWRRSWGMSNRMFISLRRHDR